MHAGPESCSGIDVEDQPGLLLMSVLHDRFGFFPGRNHKYIINPELMEVLFPVVDPVDILCLVNGDGSLTQICKGADLLDLCQDLLPDLFRCAFCIIYDEVSVFCLLQEKAEDSSAVIGRSLRQDIHKHLLFFRGCKRHIVLDLGSVQPYILHKADQYILCVRFGADSESHPFHVAACPPGKNINKDK